MAVNNFCLCDTCETEFLFPALDADQNCAGSPSLSQVTGILIIPTGVTLPTDWESKEDWEEVIDNGDTVNSSGKYLTGIGSVDAPDKTIVTIAKGVQEITIRTYTLLLEVFNLSDAQYEFLRSIQCNPNNFTFWMENAGSHLFGGEEGISPTLTDVDFPLASAENDMEKATLTIQWRATCDPPRTTIENLSENFGEVSGEGIGFWAIGDDNIVQ